jgi:hypothetical protein
MTTRRHIIQAGAVIGVAATGAAPALAASAAGRTLTYRKVAFDSRLKPSVIFAAEARRLGADIHDIDGDITGLYLDHLLKRWRSSPDPVAGMTSYSAMFVLKMMAEGAGLRMVYRAHHQPVSGEPLEWPRETARTVMAWPKGGATRTGAEPALAQTDLTGSGDAAVVSWILAPARRT